MEPLAKKAKITDHFRVALKPRDQNVKRPLVSKQNLINQATSDLNANVSNADIDRQYQLHQQHSQKKQQLLHQQQQQQQQQPQAQLQQQQQQHQQPLLPSQLYQQQQQRPPPKSSNKENIEVITINDCELAKPCSSEQKTQEPKAQSQLQFHLLQPQLPTASSRSQSQPTSQAALLPIPIPLPPPVQANNLPDIKIIKNNIIDYDATLLDNVFCEPHYAFDSFNYDKQQEVKFRTKKYLDDHELNHQITPRIRARLIDWLVDIQNDFQLEHESLYMAVKLVDQYLMRKSVLKQNLELLYLTSIFISVKFDYRPNFLTISELVQEFGGRYNRKQVINFEIDILRTLNFEIRFPLSYGFLRRYARCTTSSLQTLTLARYILESSLMEYEMIDILESKMAAASLLLAFKMLSLDMSWGETAEYYTGYKETDLDSLVGQLNEMISKPPDRKTNAIRRKYSNEVFMSVATIAPLAT